jgi:hypothetical protein
MVEENLEETLDNPEEMETPEEKTPVEESEPLKKSEDLEVLKAQRDKLYARAKKAEEENKEFKKIKPKEAEGTDEWKAKVEFLLQNRDYSEEEFDHIANVAFRKSIALSDAAKNEDEYIQYRRRKVEEQKKVPGSTSPGFVSTEKTSEEIGKMTSKEFEKYEQEMTKESSGI